MCSCVYFFLSWFCSAKESIKRIAITNERFEVIVVMNVTTQYSEAEEWQQTLTRCAVERNDMHAERMEKWVPGKRTSIVGTRIVWKTSLNGNFIPLVILIVPVSPSHTHMWWNRNTQATSWLVLFYFYSIFFFEEETHVAVHITFIVSHFWPCNMAYVCVWSFFTQVVMHFIDMTYMEKLSSFRSEEL